MRRFAGLVGVCVAMLWMGAAPAAAGGPTSVLLVAPETGMTSSLYVSQPEYERLAGLVQNSANDLTDRTSAQHATGPSVRLTWLIHDVSVWRVDEVFAEAGGGPWIATREATNDGPLPDEPVWHRAAEPGRLIQMLGTMKLLDPGAIPLSLPEIQLPASTDAGTPAAAPPSSEGSRVSLSGWRWILPGLLAGAGLAYVAVQLSPSWQRRTPEPRWDLIDESEPTSTRQ
jgi:hypothetical protein